ncbi:MAG TPA: hypothetical protein VFM18_16430 [Methanosarcina sp.]|nr:hypothetical protein [Methanosarcina sp.]
MMTKEEEIELVFLAAKACGMKLEYDSYSGFFWIESQYSGVWWSPLYNDGDALRLAVALNLRIDTGHKLYPFEYTTVSTLLEEFKCKEQHKGDPEMATRLAIVRVAAEIGKTIE